MAQDDNTFYFDFNFKNYNYSKLRYTYMDYQVHHHEQRQLPSIINSMLSNKLHSVLINTSITIIYSRKRSHCLIYNSCLPSFVIAADLKMAMKSLFIDRILAS